MWFINNQHPPKWLIVSAYCFVFSCVMSAQGGFNLRMPIEGSTGFESVYTQEDSTFLISGWTRDSLVGTYLNFSLSHIGKNGENISHRSFISTTSIYGADYDSDSFIPNFYVQPKQIYTNNEFAFRLIWFNQNSDTLFSKIVLSPFIDSTWSDSNFMLPQSIGISKDSCVFFSYGIWSYQPNGNDFCIKKFSPLGDELWTYMQSTEADPDDCYALLPSADGGVISAVVQGPIGDTPAQDKLIKIDRNGNDMWVLNNPGGYPKLINCIIGDGADVIISGRHAVPNSPVYSTKAIVLKLDTLGNTHWVRTFGEYEEFIRKDFTNVVQTCDGNYVAGGSWSSNPGSELIPDGQTNPDYDQFAFIIKLDNSTGAILWERKYRFLEIYRDQHTLIDMKATLDGGVIFCGEARDSYQILDAPYQQGWLVKLDECGCLVPGCDTLCNYVGCSVADTAFFPSFGSHFIVGPNPASQFINIFVGDLASIDLSSVQFQLYDAQGKLVYSFSPSDENTTYMLSTDKFANGLYVLQLRDGTQVLQHEKLIVEK